MAALSVAAAETIAVKSQADAETARRAARSLATALNFSAVESERVVLAVSELATNLVRYARDGEIIMTPLAGATGVGLQVESRDRGPGIPDLERALVDGYSTGGGLGGGLGGARRLMDEFEVETGPTGTRIVARLWSARRS